MPEDQAEPRLLCPLCGAFQDTEGIATGNYSSRCRICGKVSLNQQLVPSNLMPPSSEVPRPPNTRTKLERYGDLATILRIPATGPQTVRLPFVLLSLLWPILPAVGFLATSAFDDIFLQSIFGVFTIVLAGPTVAAAAGLIDSLVERNQIEITAETVTVKRERLFISRRHVIPVADIRVILMRASSTVDPYHMAGHILHRAPAEHFGNSLYVPTIQTIHHDIRVGEFLSEEEKQWLTWVLKAEVLEKSGKSV